MLYYVLYLAVICTTTVSGQNSANTTSILPRPNKFIKNIIDFAKDHYLDNNESVPVFFFIPPRSVFLFWPNAELLYEVTMNRMDTKENLFTMGPFCIENMCHCYWDESVGLVGSFTYNIILKSSSRNIVFEESFYLPWQLTLGVTSSSLLVEWDMNYGYIDKICITYKFSDKCTTAKLSEVLIENLDADQIYSGVLQMADDRSDLPFLIRTRSRGEYYSMDWVCGQNICNNHSGGSCIPATQSLIRQEKSEFSDYVASCSCNGQYFGTFCDDQEIKEGDEIFYSSRTLESSEAMLMEHAVFFSHQEKNPSHCILPSSLSLTSYWCNSFELCTILFPRMLTYFHRDAGCSNMNYEQYLFSYRLTTVENESSTCDYGSTYFPSHKTCYVHIPGKYGFQNGRNICIYYGGDIAYYTNDNALNNFLRENFNIGDKWWILGFSNYPRPPKQYIEKYESAIVDISNETVTICYDNKCPETNELICAFPQVPISNLLNEVIDYAPTCDSRICKGDYDECWWMTKAIGNSSVKDNFNLKMCFCSSNDENGCEGTKKVIEPNNGTYNIQYMVDHYIDISYVYFGFFGESKTKVVCRSYAALALLQLKCNGKQFCSINERDMHSHLKSSCHPMLISNLTVVFEYQRIQQYELYCEQISDSEYISNNWELVGVYVHFCLYISTSLSDTNVTKYECNERGWDLAYFRDSSVPWDIIDNDYNAIWAEQYVPNESEKRFFLYPQNPVVFRRNGDTSRFGVARTLCFGPPKIVLKDTATETTTSTTSTTEKSPTETSSSSSSTESSTTAEPIKNCMVNETFNGLSLIWKDQEAGETSIKPCPGPFKGNVTWSCDADGEWDTKFPDISGCSYLVNYEEYSQMIYDVSVPLNETLIGLQEDIDSGVMAPGDIRNSLDLLIDAEERNNYDVLQVEDATDLMLSYTKNAIGVVDNNLNQTKSWRGLQHKSRIDAINRIQLQTTEVSVNLSVSALLQNSKIYYEEDAIYVSIESQNEAYYANESNRQFCHPNLMFYPTCITLPETITQFLQENQQIAVTMVAYSTLHCLFPGGIPCQTNEAKDLYSVGTPNTAVVGSTVGEAKFITSDDNPVVANFKHVYPGNVFNLKNKRCAWWDEGEWNTTGCFLVESNNIATTCHCNHLTNLAVIMDINGVLEGHETLTNMTEYITIIGMSFSIVCLLITIVILIIKIELSRKTNIIHINLCSNLLISEIILMAGLNAIDNEIICAVVAGLLFYFFLATFSWSMVEAVHVYFLFVKVFPSARSMLRIYAIFAYSFPAAIVLISVAATKGEGFGTEEYCWLDFNEPLIWAFAAPLLLILLINYFVYGLAIRTLVNHKRRSVAGSSTDMQPQKKMLRASITLSTVLCLTWSLGFSYIFEGTRGMAFVFAAVNSIQGVVLFVVLILFNKDIMAYLKDKFGHVRQKRKLTSYDLHMESDSRHAPGEQVTSQITDSYYLTSAAIRSRMSVNASEENT